MKRSLSIENVVGGQQVTLIYKQTNTWRLQLRLAVHCCGGCRPSRVAAATTGPCFFRSWGSSPASW